MSGEDHIELRLGSRTRAGWLWSGIWLIYLLVPLIQNFQRQYALWQQIAGIIAFWLFGYAYALLATRNRGQADFKTFEPWGADRDVTLLLLVVVVIAAVLPIIAAPAWVALWIYVASACGAAIPQGKRRWALVGGYLATGAMVLEAAVRRLDLGTWAWMVLPSIFSCYAVIGVRRMRNLIAELHQAREEVKHLAASEERLRLARDLHDLAGHSMATITLKAELARRLLSTDAAAAQKQISDIEQVSRQALADIREAVSGYRRATLAVETASARTALEAAQIAFDVDPALLHRSGALDPDAEAALAWCLREAVTNVVRHSGATWCRARLIEARVNSETTLTLEVTDDGRAVPPDARLVVEAAEGERAGQTYSGPAADGASGGEPSTPVWGNGLTGLRERLVPFAATLTAQPLRPHGFQVCATLPVR